MAMANSGDPSTPMFTLLVDERTGIGRGVEMDGVELPAVRTATVVTRTADVTTVTIEFITTHPVETRAVTVPGTVPAVSW